MWPIRADHKNWQNIHAGYYWLILDSSWIVTPGRVLVLIQVPALARRQTSTRPAPNFQKLPAQLPHKRGAKRCLKSLKKNSQPDRTWKARRRGWAPLNRLAPHPLFPSCSFSFVFGSTSLCLQCCLQIAYQFGVERLNILGRIADALRVLLLCTAVDVQPDVNLIQSDGCRANRGIVSCHSIQYRAVPDAFSRGVKYLFTGTVMPDFP